ncbi:MAG: hypothetical protein FWG10_10715 [Eubacteriaceae bacterium]|nr:hypothetical protein [Eubacteriaceae bacterium]
MKKRFIFLLLAMLVFATACGGNGSKADPPAGNGSGSGGGGQEAQTNKIPDGFVEKTLSEVPIVMSIPEAWFYVDTSTANLDELYENMENLGIGEDYVEIAKQASMVYMLDIANNTDEFTPNFNITCTDSGGIRQSDLKDGIEPLTAIYAEQFSVYPFSGFSWVNTLSGKNYGDNYYLVMVANYTISGISVRGCQAITINNDKNYTFTYVSLEKDFKDEMFTVFESVLGTIEFTD